MHSAYSTTHKGRYGQQRLPVAEKPTPTRTSGTSKSEDEAVLKLEDTSAGAIASPGGGGAKKATDKNSLTDSPWGESGIGEGSTGGFETLLGTLVVEGGLVTPEELAQCGSLLEEATKQDKPRTLADLLVENEFVTKRQLDRIRNEFEAKKSTQRIPGYRIQKKLGSGAMATVFLAHQLSLDRSVAIKVLPKKFSDNVGFIERFYKEGRAAAKLNHPNIVGAYDVGQAGEHHYFVMEFIDGLTVHDRLVKEKRIAELEAIRVVAQVAKALEHAHTRGFIHRDIKPKNVMINSQGTVKLADLGLARALSDNEAANAEAGRAYGTPYYISPEQIRGEVKIGPQADIYCLGATFYHMVTGRVPYEGKNPSDVMHKHLRANMIPPDHVNPKLSPGCAQVIEMMMAKSPADRYHSATDLLHDLDLIAQGQPPHFARAKMNLAEVATSIASDTTESSKALPLVQKDASSLIENPIFVVVMVLLIISALINVALILL